MENLNLRNTLECGCVIDMELLVYRTDEAKTDMAKATITDTNVELCEKHQKDL